MNDADRLRLLRAQLEPARVEEVSALVDSIVEHFTPCHRDFVSWIDELIAAEE